MLKRHLLREAFPDHLIRPARASRAMTLNHLPMCWVLLKQTQRWSARCRGGAGLSESGKINCDVSSTKPCPPQQRALQASIGPPRTPRLGLKWPGLCAPSSRSHWTRVAWDRCELGQGGSLQLRQVRAACQAHPPPLDTESLLDGGCGWHTSTSPTLLPLL